jgi:hypothetical protein
LSCLPSLATDESTKLNRKYEKELDSLMAEEEQDE